jgi:soluble lytic murein transglycosylase-like protein
MTEMPRTGFVARGKRAAVVTGLAAAGALAAAAWPAGAQVLDIQPDGSVVTYSGPAVYTDAGVRSLSPTPATLDGGLPRTVPAAVAEAIRASSERHGVSSSLLEAVAWQESRFHQTAVSPKGALGVMQLMPATARGLGADATDLVANIDAGAAYLSQMLQRFDGDLPRALAAYNAGPAAVTRFGGVPPYAETRAYVGSILGNLARASLGLRPE